MRGRQIKTLRLTTWLLLLLALNQHQGATGHSRSIFSSESHFGTTNDKQDTILTIAMRTERSNQAQVEESGQSINALSFFLGGRKQEISRKRTPKGKGKDIFRRSKGSSQGVIEQVGWLEKGEEERGE